MKSLVNAIVVAATLIVAADVAAPQQPQPQALNWNADDSAHIAFLAARGYRVDRKHVVIWAPRDSISEAWVRALADTLDRGVSRLRELIKAPRPWQRIGGHPVTFYFSPGRFVSHGSGLGAVFISVSRVKDHFAPFLHEASHELLAPMAPFYGSEYSDSTRGAQAEERMPLWLFEGIPDYLAQTAAPLVGSHEGDVFEIGGLGKADSVCAVRVRASAQGPALLEALGRDAAPAALFTTDRQQVAPTFYACAQSLTRHLVEYIGLRATVELMPAIKRGDWRESVQRHAGISMETIRTRWLQRLGLAVVDSSAAHVGASLMISSAALKIARAGWAYGIVPGRASRRPKSHASRPGTPL